MSREQPSPESTGESAANESGPDKRKHELREEFLKSFEENLFNEHLTVEQLTDLLKRVKDLDTFFDANADSMYFDILEHVQDRMGGYTDFGLRGVINPYDSRGDVNLKTFCNEIFAPIHRKSLKSNLKRHDDGLRVGNIGVTGRDIKDIVERVLKQTEDFRIEDTEQNYDRAVLKSLLSRSSLRNWKTIELVARLFDVKPDLASQTIGEFVDTVERFDLESVPEFRSTIDFQNARSLAKRLGESIGPDVRELSASVLRDYMKEEVRKREEEFEDEVAAKGSNYQI